VGLRCIIPPRHLSQLKDMSIPLRKPQEAKNFAVLRSFSMGYAIFGLGATLYICNEKLLKDGKVLCHLGFQSKVLPGPLTDLND
jgi:hypothetical protein